MARKMIKKTALRIVLAKACLSIRAVGSAMKMSAEAFEDFEDAKNAVRKMWPEAYGETMSEGDEYVYFDRK